MYLIVPIVLLGRFVDSATGLNTELLSVSKYYKFNFFITLVLLALTVIFNYILIPRYGIYGAAWANTIAFASFNIGKFLFIWLKMKHQPFTGKSPIIILAAIPATLAGYLIPHIQNPFADTFVRSGIILILFGSAVYLLKASEEFNQMIKTLKEKKRLY
jgi:O-antigen/teichoic acid export membrane protein